MSKKIVFIHWTLNILYEFYLPSGSGCLVCSCGELCGHWNSNSSSEVHPGLEQTTIQVMTNCPLITNDKAFNSLWLMIGLFMHISLQSSPISLIRVITLSLARVKYQSTSTSDSVGHTIHTKVELVTDCLIRVAEISMLSGAPCTGLSWLKVRSTWNCIMRYRVIGRNS